VESRDRFLYRMYFGRESAECLERVFSSKEVLLQYYITTGSKGEEPLVLVSFGSWSFCNISSKLAAF